MSSKKLNPAEQYNRIRRILFSTVNDPLKGIDVARQYLQNTYSHRLGNKATIGLFAELDFWDRYRRKLFLTPTLDAGDHSDFSGFIDGRPVRIDVTTSIGCKDPAHYAPFLFDEIGYKIAYLHNGTFELVDVCDMWFPKCEACGSPMFPIIAMGGENQSMGTGNPLFTYDQVYTNFCPLCLRCDGVKNSWSHIMMKPPTEYMHEVSMFYTEHDESGITNSECDYNDYMVKLWCYFRKLVGINLMGICEITDLNQDMKHGDPIPGISFKYLNPNFKPIIGGSVRCDGIYELF